jgi:hypothetical protein
MQQAFVDQMTLPQFNQRVRASPPFKNNVLLLINFHTLARKEIPCEMPLINLIKPQKINNPIWTNSHLQDQ